MEDKSFETDWDKDREEDPEDWLTFWWIEIDRRIMMASVEEE